MTDTLYEQIKARCKTIPVLPPTMLSNQIEVRKYQHWKNKFGHHAITDLPLLIAALELSCSHIAYLTSTISKGKTTAASPSYFLKHAKEKLEGK